MSRFVLVARAVTALTSIVPPIGLVVMSDIMRGKDQWRLGVLYWLAALTLLIVAKPLAARATVLEATVAGVAAVGFLGWVNPVLTAVAAVPLVAGTVTNRRAAATRATGMSSVGAALARVSANTAQLVSAGHSERVRRDHSAMVDRFHDVFSAQTRRLSAAMAVVEIAFSPVTILAVVLTAGMVLVIPGADLLAFLLLGPAVGGCIATLIRHPPTGAPSQVATGAQASMRATMLWLRSAIAPGSDVRKAAIAAVVTALLHGVGLALAITVVRSLLDQRGSPWPALFLLLAVAIAHTLALRWSTSSAQVAGVAVLRQLSHRIIDRILIAPEGSLTEYKDQLPCLVTRDVVTVSGLPVHALRSFVLAVLTPVTAMLTMVITDWRTAVSTLLLFPLVSLTVPVLFREPYGDLRSAHEATGRVLAFLAR